MFVFDYHQLGSVGEEVLNSSFGLASDAIEIQLHQETLVWGLVKGLRAATSSTNRITYVSQERLLRKPC